jgi:toxin ParE1/3/4
VSFRLTEAASHDIERILQDTLELFGPKQFQVYAQLIDAALNRIGRDPDGLGTFGRGDIAPGVRSFRLDTVARRRGAASHSVYYLPPAGEQADVVILRMLHDRMEPRRQITSDEAVLETEIDDPTRL